MEDILVLDDIADAGLMLKRLLERKGHQVAVFTEEEEALAHIRAHPVKVAISRAGIRRFMSLCLPLRRVKNG